MANEDANEAQNPAVQPQEFEEPIEAAAQSHAHANVNQPAIQQVFANYQVPPPEKFRPHLYGEKLSRVPETILSPPPRDNFTERLYDKKLAWVTEIKLTLLNYSEILL